ncbi:MAG: hypothetical protein AB7G28_03380 [Pirellulales bacterium]
MSSVTLSPVAARFAWKEYRTLRGFWLAACVIAALLQAVTIALAPPSSDPVTTVFGIALAAAALYAVGVAATTFSMEHEEETYAYLSGLPTRWLPLFTGKASFAVTSSLMLAALLLITAWQFAGMRAPSAAQFSLLLSTFGFAIIEMLAWGMFFSLLIRQPLLAALLAIGAESLAVTWIANIFGERTDNFMMLESYAGVLVPRIAVAVCILVIDVLVARRWLVQEHQGKASETTAPAPSTSDNSRPLTYLRGVASRGAALIRHHSPRVLGHLLWHTWRQSWKPMLAMSLIVPGLCFMLLLIADMLNMATRIRFSHLVMFPYPIALLAMAIYWSVVFYADQRQFKYRFLAEHAVWPRYVWFSRLAVWSMPIALAAILAAIVSISATFDFIAAMRRQFPNIVYYNPSWDTRYLAEQWRDLDIASRSLAFGLWGAALGFALGQATSLFFRRALVAGFAALALALPLGAWGLAAWTWQLKPPVFLLPIALGLVAATWLRVPDWLVDRKSFASWAKVAAAVLIPLVFIAWRLPAARSISLEDKYQALTNLEGPIQVGGQLQFSTGLPFHADQIVAHWVEQSAADLPEKNQATVDRLVRLGEKIDYPPRPDKLVEEEGMGMGSYGDEYLQALVAANEKILKEAVPLALGDYRLTVSEGGFSRVQDLRFLLREAARWATRDGQLDAALEFHLAALTLWERLWNGPSTNVYQSVQERLRAQSGLVRWAGAKGQTSERIKRAIAALDRIYPPVTEREPTPDTVSSIALWTPPPQIVATHEQLRAIIRGKEPTRLLGKDASVDDYVAVMSNELPLERARALSILDYLTIAEVAQWRNVIWRLNQEMLRDWSQHNVLVEGEDRNEDIGFSLRRKIQQVQSGSNYFNRYDDDWKPENPPYSWLRTSPFLRRELQKNRSFGGWLASVVNADVAGLGLRQQLALLAYRADHGSYPGALADLVSDYLPFVPIDPYTGREFAYRPQGLELELRSFYDASHESIAAHTPLLWSTGALGRAPEATFVTEASGLPDGVTQGRIRHEVYQVWDNNLLVFPLPRIEKADP